MNSAWYLESVAADGLRRTHAVHKLPFRIGRDTACDLAVDARGLSRQHAELRADPSGAGLLLVDLDSTNGTYVNRQRISGTLRVQVNDVLHFGNAEFRLGAESATRMAAMAEDDGRTRIVPQGQALTENFVREEPQFLEVLAGNGLSAAVQPIVQADTGEVFAYELLGRCTHPALAQPPSYLFHLARTLDREAELSAAFRLHGLRAIGSRLAGTRLFVNSHPSETFTEAFFESLVLLAAQPGAPHLVVEVHETAVIDVPSMRSLAARLKEIGVSFAYDDFGAGQARINELADVPPHFVKFDMALIRGLDAASSAKQGVVRGHVRMVLDVGSVPLAEGVETEAEAAICRDMGFQLIQGYLTGRPVPVEALPER